MKPTTCKAIFLQVGMKVWLTADGAVLQRAESSTGLNDC